ncbi:hypothetical protein JHK84_034371 [Glycine max]|nr:hypothetical protein JHK86_034105 [Glycine max]KAG5140603.1 hypothetical protein JHK84_034371 [Glycine max]
MISKGNNPIEEVDIRKLPYLQAIVKETLRLHQPVPFLLPPKAGKDMDIGGYTISKDAKVLRPTVFGHSTPSLALIVPLTKSKDLGICISNPLSFSRSRAVHKHTKAAIFVSKLHEYRANAILAVSLVVYKAAAALKKIPWLRKVVVEGHLGRTVTHKLQLHPRLSR